MQLSAFSALCVTAGEYGLENLTRARTPARAPSLFAVRDWLPLQFHLDSLKPAILHCRRRRELGLHDLLETGQRLRRI